MFGFTSIDKDLPIAGLNYAAATGFTPSAIANRADLSVPNLDVGGLLDALFRHCLAATVGAALDDSAAQDGDALAAALAVFRSGRLLVRVGSAVAAL